MAQRTKAARGRRNGGSKMILTAILLLPVIGVLLPTCVVLAINMAPTAAAYMIDRTREKYLAITVGLLNFCGTLPAEAQLWNHGQSYDVAFGIVTDPYYWLLSYGSAGTGWLIYIVLPLILSNYYAMTTNTRVQSLRRRQQALIEAWGEEVAAAGRGQDPQE